MSLLERDAHTATLGGRRTKPPSQAMGTNVNPSLVPPLFLLFFLDFFKKISDFFLKIMNLFLIFFADPGVCWELSNGHRRQPKPILPAFSPNNRYKWIAKGQPAPIQTLKQKKSLHHSLELFQQLPQKEFNLGNLFEDHGQGCLPYQKKKLKSSLATCTLQLAPCNLQLAPCNLQLQLQRHVSALLLKVTKVLRNGQCCNNGPEALCVKYYEKGPL